jgi:predicted permease
MQDVLIALRQFRKAPAFAVTVILTIALGIGANTAIFTLVHGILLRSLPVSDPHQLYRVGDLDDCCVNGGYENQNGDFDLYSWPLYKYLQQTTPEFEQLAAMQSGSGGITVRRGSEPAKTEDFEYVSGNYFDTLGVSAFAGRTFTQADDHPGAALNAVLSYAAWQSVYGGDPRVIGATFYMQNQPVTVVGIAPHGFFGDRIRSNPPAFWVTLSSEPVIDGKNALLPIPESNWLYVLGRVKPGTVIGSLQAKMSADLRRWLATQPAYTRNGGSTMLPRQHVVIVPGGEGIQNLQQQTEKGLYLLMAISALVLLVACANIANLLLARGSTRRAETSLRMALGAARSRLIRQMLTESVLLACLGGVAGLALAYAGTRMILALAFPDAPNLPIAATPSLPVLGFAFLLSLATGVVFGIVPAWISSHADPAESLRGVNRSTRDSTSLPQRSLIVFQAGLSLVLLVSAGLLTQSLNRLEHQNFGIETANRYVLHLDPAGAGYTAATLPALNQQLEEQFGAIPGVQDVGLALYSPLEGNNWGEAVFIAGRPAPGPETNNGSSWDRISPQFFDAVGQRIIRGRGIKEDDTATSQMVAVVNQAFVRKFFPKENPIGRYFGDFDQKYANSFLIVGVVADAKYNNPRDEVRPMYFRPLDQRIPGLTIPNLMRAEDSSLFINSITLRFDRAPTNLDATARHILANINPNLTVIDLHTLAFQVNGNFTQDRLIARLTALFGVLALILASVGLYGITSYQIARRTSEIGLRMALGASRGNVIRMVMRGALMQVALGLGLGIPVAILGAHFMQSQLYQVSSWSPLILLASALVLLLCAAFAGFLPARRAASIEPVIALRSE